MYDNDDIFLPISIYQLNIFSLQSVMIKKIQINTEHNRKNIPGILYN